MNLHRIKTKSVLAGCEQTSCFAPKQLHPSQPSFTNERTNPQVRCLKSSKTLQNCRKVRKKSRARRRLQAFPRNSTPAQQSEIRAAKVPKIRKGEKRVESRSVMAIMALTPELRYFPALPTFYVTSLNFCGLPMTGRAGEPAS